MHNIRTTRNAVPSFNFDSITHDTRGKFDVCVNCQRDRHDLAVHICLRFEKLQRRHTTQLFTVVFSTKVRTHRSNHCDYLRWMKHHDKTYKLPPPHPTVTPSHFVHQNRNHCQRLWTFAGPLPDAFCPQIYFPSFRNLENLTIFGLDQLWKIGVREIADNARTSCTRGVFLDRSVLNPITIVSMTFRI